MTAVDPFDLARFRAAQDRPHGGFEAAMAELRAGRKVTHWIWWVFPQVRGLGSSSVSERFAVEGLDEAVAYLADPVLQPRYAEAVAVVRGQVAAGVPVPVLMGSRLDAMKLVSSLTLFAAAMRARKGEAGVLERDIAAVLDDAAAQGFTPCRATLAAI